MSERRTTATSFLDRKQIAREVFDLRFALSSLEILFEEGSNEMQVFRNATKGIGARLDWLHDSLLNEKT